MRTWREGSTIFIELGKFRVVSFKSDIGLLKRMDRAVERFGYRNRSDLIREAVELYLELLDRCGPIAKKLLEEAAGVCAGWGSR